MKRDLDGREWLYPTTGEGRRPLPKLVELSVFSLWFDGRTLDECSLRNRRTRRISVDDQNLPMSDILIAAQMRDNRRMNAQTFADPRSPLMVDSDVVVSAPNRALAAATVALWAAAWLLLTARAIADGAPDLGTGALVRAGAGFIGCGFCYLMHLILRRLQFRKFSRGMFAGAILAVVAAELFGWVTILFSRMMTGGGGPSTPGLGILMLGFYAWIFFSWVTMYLALTYSSRVFHAEQRVSLARAEASSAQLRALRYQLNPHFLFNTLNSLSALILERRIADAERMVMRLSGFLRSTLMAEPLSTIRAADEIETQKRYLLIEQVRFPDLELNASVQPEIANAQVPPLILQPLVENAIKFAVARSPGPTLIEVTAVARGGDLILTVRDDGAVSAASAPVDGTGVGLRNVRERLRAIYGDDASLTIERGQTRGFTVRIQLPLRVRDAEASYSYRR